MYIYSETDDGSKKRFILTHDIAGSSRRNVLQRSGSDPVTKPKNDGGFPSRGENVILLHQAAALHSPR